MRATAFVVPPALMETIVELYRPSPARDLAAPLAIKNDKVKVLSS